MDRTTVQRDLVATDSGGHNGPPETVMGRDGKTYPATPRAAAHEADTEVVACEELARRDSDDDFDNVGEDDDSPTTLRFTASGSVYNYVEQVAAIGLASDNGTGIDLTTPLTAEDLPPDLRRNRNVGGPHRH